MVVPNHATETKKLYGHTNDIQSMAISSNGRVIATACKARDAEHAVVILWDTSSYLPAASLPGHDSTVACLRFNPSNR